MKTYSDSILTTFLSAGVLLLSLTCLNVFANDPTRPPTSSATVKAVKQTAVKASEQPLTAIISKNNKTLAVIEGKFYRQGDYYRGNKVLRIDLDKVLLSSSSGNFELTLIPKIKK